MARNQIGRRLLTAINEMEDLRDSMERTGLFDEADSLSTVLADLRWQYDELR